MSHRVEGAYVLLALAVFALPSGADERAERDSNEVAAGAPAPIRASGFIEMAYAVSSRGRDGRIVGDAYQPRHAEFMLSAAAVRLERTPPPHGNGAGFVIEAMAGEHATAVRAAGLDLGPNADLVQAFGSFGIPCAGLVVTAGKMATMLGHEVIESPANPNLSVGYTYLVLENFTDLGLDVAWAGMSGWSARARVVNGWDVAVDNNDARTVFGRLGWSDGPRSVAVLGYMGSESPDSIGGRREGLEFLASGKLGKVPVMLQLDAGREERLRAKWRAASVWLLLPLRQGAGLHLRGEVVDDFGGSRTSGVLGFPTHTGQTLAALTATLDIRSFAGALIRPEIRYDHSSIAAFADARHQWTMALGAALLY